MEVKFNPWHDTRTGQFTFDGQGQRFAGGGGIFGGGGASRVARRPKTSTSTARRPKQTFDGFGGGRSGGGGATGSWEDLTPKKPSAKRAPAKRVIVTPLPRPKKKPAPVAPPPKPKPEAFRDVEPSRPPAVEKPESVKPIGAPPPKSGVGILEVGLGAGAALAAVAKPVVATTISASGYNFGVDLGTRTVGVAGKLRLQPNQRRSKGAQPNAGKPDRLPSDHGGHFIAREFGGPEIPANHFAQDAKVNRSQYRKLEIIWKKALKRAQEVDVDIVPKYKGNSKRPHSLDVRYTIDGKTVRKTIPNVKEEK